MEALVRLERCRPPQSIEVAVYGGLPMPESEALFLSNWPIVRVLSVLLLFVIAASAANAQSEATKISLTKKNGLYYAQVTINGNAALLLIDTGASITLLNRKFSGLA